MTATAALSGAFLFWLAIWLSKGNLDLTPRENPKFFVSLALSTVLTLGGGVACMIYAFTH